MIEVERLRHVFIVNPAAGKGDNEKLIRQAADATFDQSGEIFEIVMTKAPRDAERIAHEQAQRGEPVRLYACGGDGTLCEVANGAAHYGNAEIACIPIGTGNDYVKSYGRVEDFLDLPALVTGSAVSVDLMRVNDNLAVNLCSMGFDAEVAINLTRFNKLPLVTGPMAYNMSIMYCLLKKMRTAFSIQIDDQEPLTGEFLLCVVANGGWYGSGYHAAPAAKTNDGILDYVVAMPTSRIGFIKMVNKYRMGQHESVTILKHYTGKRLEVSSPDPFALSYDGESAYIKQAIFEVVPDAMKFVLPQSCLAKGEYGKFHKTEMI